MHNFLLWLIWKIQLFLVILEKSLPENHASILFCHFVIHSNKYLSRIGPKASLPDFSHHLSDLDGKTFDYLDDEEKTHGVIDTINDEIPCEGSATFFDNG